MEKNVFLVVMVIFPPMAMICKVEILKVQRVRGILLAHFPMGYHTRHLIVLLQIQAEVPAPGTVKNLRKRTEPHPVMQVNRLNGSANSN